MSANSTKRSVFKRARTRTGALMVALSLVAACASPSGYTFQPDRLPTDRHKITVREVKERVTIPVNVGQVVLSSADVRALNLLAAEFHNRAHGPITLMMPAGAHADEAAVALAAHARTVLNEAGVPYSAMRGARYDARGLGETPLVAAFPAFVAEAPDCLNAWGDFSVTYSGGNTDNFGCASQAALAAMIADPRDLVGPGPMTPGDTARRLEVLDRYRSGETTATERSEDESAQVSDAVE